MSTLDFLLVFGCCLVSMLICRCLPIFVLKGRDLPEGLQAALNFIPPAAFAALVANDLYSPGMFDAGLWPALLPFAASLVVVVVGKKSGSLIWCVVVGVLCYAVLSAL